MTESQLPLAQLSALLFTLIGPIALIPTFAALTKEADWPLRRRLAFLAALTALGAFALAVFVGAASMAKAGTTPPALIAAAGVILLIAALRTFFASKSAGAPSAGPPAIGVALTPLAIPNIVTPVGVAVLIIFASYFPAFGDRLLIMAAVAGIVAGNLVAMLGAHFFMNRIGPAPLVFLGAVFGVLQAGLGVQMIFDGLRLSGLAT